MSKDMTAIQAIISQAQKKAGLESIALISSLGLPVASVGVDMNMGVAARTVFSIFERASSELGLGASEHILIGGSNRNFIVKPLRKNDGGLHSWFVSVSPSFGKKGLLDESSLKDEILVTTNGVESAKSIKIPIEEVHLFSATTALWSAIQMISGIIDLGSIFGAVLDGVSKRFILIPDGENWRVTLTEKHRRTGTIDVELDKAAITLKSLLL